MTPPLPPEPMLPEAVHAALLAFATECYDAGMAGAYHVPQPSESASNVVAAIHAAIRCATRAEYWRLLGAVQDELERQR